MNGAEELQRAQEEHRVVTRLLALRRAGKVGIIMVECGVYYISDNTVNPWGDNKRRYTILQLAALVESLEMRKPAQSETECNHYTKEAQA